jgi:hypothetical protein
VAPPPHEPTVATNMTLALPALFAFACGRGAQEKTIAESGSS